MRLGLGLLLLLLLGVHGPLLLLLVLRRCSLRIVLLLLLVDTVLGLVPGSEWLMVVDNPISAGPGPLLLLLGRVHRVR